MRLSPTLRLLALLPVTVALAAGPAMAACQKLGFSVNDYGKEGPTNDAKKLLDKYVAEWTAKHGITKYRAGKKDVSCELFLDVGFFDEWTCKAVTTVCWDGKPVSADAGETVTQTAPRKPRPAAQAPAKAKPAAANAPAAAGASPIATGAIPKATAPATPTVVPVTAAPATKAPATSAPASTSSPADAPKAQ